MGKPRRKIDARFCLLADRNGDLEIPKETFKELLARTKPGDVIELDNGAKIRLWNGGKK